MVATTSDSCKPVLLLLGLLFFASRVEAQFDTAWAARAGGVTNDGLYTTSLLPYYHPKIVMDPSGNLILAGAFASPTFTLGPFSLTNRGSWDVFVAKLNSSGTPLWLLQLGGNDDDRLKGLAVDSSGTIFVTGYYTSSQFRCGSLAVTNAGQDDVFLVKVSTTVAPLWLRRAGGTGDDAAYGLALDSVASPILCGTYQYSLFSAGAIVLPPRGMIDGFLVKYDSDGNALWARCIGGRNDDGAYRLRIDGSNNVFVTGTFYSTDLSVGNVIFGSPVVNGILGGTALSRSMIAQGISFGLRK